MYIKDVRYTFSYYTFSCIIGAQKKSSENLTQKPSESTPHCSSIAAAGDMKQPKAKKAEGKPYDTLWT
jgi:hypothetical protein